MMQLLDNINLKSGEKIELYKINGSNPNAKNILIIGVFHGEEPQGYIAVKNFFMKENSICSSKNNIFIIPCLNPDGMKVNKRQNSNGVDLNRNFPTKNWKKETIESEYYGGEIPSSEEETKFIIEIINKYKFDLILTLHSPYAIVNYDGPAKNEADIISKLSGYPVKASIGYPTPGSFGTYCGIERNIKTITLEYDENEELTNLMNKSAAIFRWLMESY